MEEAEQGGCAVGRTSLRPWEGERSQEQRICAVSGRAWNRRNFSFSCSWLIYKDSQNSCKERMSRMSNVSFPAPEHSPSSKGRGLLQSTKPSSVQKKELFCCSSSCTFVVTQARPSAQGTLMRVWGPQVEVCEFL